MLAGELYDASAPELVAERLRARRLLGAYNAADPADRDGRTRLLAELIGSLGDDVWIEPPFFCDYGSNITLGDRTYLNFNCVVLDCAAVEIRAGAATRSGGSTTRPRTRWMPRPGPPARSTRSRSRSAPTRGSAARPSSSPVSRSARTRSSARGSVVTRDAALNVVAAGNPCRVIRELEDSR